MDAHLAEVGAEARLHECLTLGGSGRPDNFASASAAAKPRSGTAGLSSLRATDRAARPICKWANRAVYGDSHERATVASGAAMRITFFAVDSASFSAGSVGCETRSAAASCNCGRGGGAHHRRRRRRRRVRPMVFCCGAAPMGPYSARPSFMNSRRTPSSRSSSAMAAPPRLSAISDA